MVVLGFVKAQSLPDLLNEPPANWHTYNENLGQLLNTDGEPEPYVRYYTEGTFPRIFCWENVPAAGPNSTFRLLTFSWADLADSIGDTSTYYRVDMSVKGEQAAGPEPTTEELADGHLNYYFPHTQPNGVVGVRRYQRVVYEEIYPKIDMHLYSSEIGLKAYFVVRPGGDPDMIVAHFDGQDSITTDTLGIRMWMGQKNIHLAQSFAYEVDGSNNVTPLMWTPEFLNAGNGDVTFQNLGSWNTSNKLILQIGGGMTLGASSINTPQWCTYYGQDGEDFANDVKAAENGKIYMTGKTYSSSIPHNQGQTVVFDNHGVGDGYVTCFNGDDYSIAWATTIGGIYDDGLEDMVLKTDEDTLRVWAIGSTFGDGLLTDAPSNFQGYFEGGSITQSNKALLVRLYANDGHSDYRSYFGGNNTEGYAIAADSEGNLYIGGTTANDSINENAQCVFDINNPHRFTVCDPSGGAYYQNFNGYDTYTTGQGLSLADGFIAKFEANTMNMQWSTLFGGYRADVIADLFVDGDDNLYFAGRTKTDYTGDPNATCVVPTNGDFPICDAGGTAFYQFHANGTIQNGVIWDGFIGRFDASHNITWSTFIGGEDMEGASSVYVSPEGSIYFAGWTSTDQTDHVDTYNGEFPVLSSGSEYSQSFGGGMFDAWLWRFNSSLEPEYGTLVGGEGDELEYRAPQGWTSEVIRHEPNISLSDNGLVFVSGFTTAPNASGADNFPFEWGTGLYNQNGNNDAYNSDYDKSDAFLLGIDGSNEMMYSSYFGGSGFGASTVDNNVGDAGDAISIIGNKIFMVGRSFSTENFPHACPTGAYCNNNPSGVVNSNHSTAYIAQLNEKLWILADESVETTDNRALTAYPNPFTERVYLQVPSKNRVSYSLRDLTGKQIASGNVKVGEGIECGNLPAGVYLLQIDNSNSQVFRIVKQ